MLGGIGYQELLVVGVVAILLFGKKLPDVARTWGNSYRDLRRSLNDIKSSFSADHYESPKSKRPAVEFDDRVSDSSPRFVPPSDDESDSQPKAETLSDSPT
jgi:sec-independent protein translocase protein TatA